MIEELKSLLTEAKAELDSANSVDLLCAFVMWRGVRLLDSALSKISAAGVPSSMPTLERRLQTMDAAGVDIQLLSVSAPNVYRFPRDFRRALTRETNDELIDVARASNGRLPALVSLPLPDAVNVVQPGYFDPGRYRSDSNQHWRSGCPHAELAAGTFDWVQVLVHPEIWVYDGATMRETMASQLDAERELRLRQMGENRIDLT